MISNKQFEECIRTLLKYIGETPNRAGLIDTPHRILKLYEELFWGYKADPGAVLKEFDNEGHCYDSIILLKDIEFYSMCEHHLMPFFGKAHVAYIPGEGGKIVGLSKLARLVEIYARRLQVQERMGEQVTEALERVLGCKGAACIIEARHMCVAARGVEKQHSIMVTSSLRGALYEGAARGELMQLIKQ